MFGFLKGGNAAAGGDIDAKAAADMVKAGTAALVDVREDDEWRAMNVKGAVHLPLSRLVNGLAKLPRDKQLIFFCASGMRSARAMFSAKNAGLDVAGHVPGGIGALKRAGL